MRRRYNPKQRLKELARNIDSLVDLPYSPEFEKVCSEIKPSPSIQDKRAIWEQVLKLQSGSAPTSAPPPPPSESDSLIPTTQATEFVGPSKRSPERASERTGFLFPVEEPLRELQPWSSPGKPSLSPEQIDRRRQFLADIASSRLASTEQRVAYILQHFPETRDSDTALCIRYWQKFQAEVLEGWQPLELEVLFVLDRIETLGRVRRLIQNELKLFRGIEDTRRSREAIQREFHEYVAAHRDTAPEVRFYLDETGNEGSKAYTGVAGICAINWKQYEKHHAALDRWRAKQGWSETIHFAETGEDKVGRAVSLLQQLHVRRAGLLFVGYSVVSRGRTNEDMFSLFAHLVLDSLKYLRTHGCLSENRRVKVFKESDSGFDSIYLSKMTKHLEDEVALEFPGQLAVLPVEAVTKGRHVLLECADLVAGGMQRRALGKGHNPKDRLAEAIINVTGFEDPSDMGALIKHYPPAR